MRQLMDISKKVGVGEILPLYISFTALAILCHLWSTLSLHNNSLDLIHRIQDCQEMVLQNDASLLSKAQELSLSKVLKLI
jgi:hypothetical protein